METEDSIKRDVRIREMPIATHAQWRSVADTVTTYQPTRIAEPHELWRVTLGDGRTVRTATVRNGDSQWLVLDENGKFSDIEEVAVC